MRWLVPLLAIALSACAGVERLAIPPVQEESPVWADHTPGSVERVDHGAWSAFLAAYLKTDADGVNRLDYGRVSDVDRAALDGYLDRLSGTDIVRLDRDEQLAFWINLYNAQTVAVVLDSYPVRSIRSIKPGGAFSIGPWNAKVVTVKARPLSLHDIEHGIIRAFWKDPRIHYALNCAAVGCPNLAPTVYSGDGLESSLAEAERAYVNDPRGVWFDPKGRLHLSKIYLWYREDFGATQTDVLRGLAEIAQSEKTRERLARAPWVFAYIYDWTLNDTATVGAQASDPEKPALEVRMNGVLSTEIKRRVGGGVRERQRTGAD